MVSEEGEISEGPLRHRHVAHYHGDTVRALFIAEAVVLLIAETTGASLPIATLSIVLFAVALVVAAGITNPAQTWIHFVNALLALYGAVTFGLYAIEEYHLARDIFGQTYLSTELLAILFLISVYFTTKTVRGIMLRPHLK